MRCAVGEPVRCVCVGGVDYRMVESEGSDL